MVVVCGPGFMYMMKDVHCLIITKEPSNFHLGLGCNDIAKSLEFHVDESIELWRSYFIGIVVNAHMNEFMNRLGEPRNMQYQN